MKMGDIIKQLREEKGITQEQLGTVIGVLLYKEWLNILVFHHVT